MHPKYIKADELSKRVIGAAIEVHREKGPGLIESIYEKCMMRELQLQGVNAENQLTTPIEYKGYIFEETLRLDILVEFGGSSCRSGSLPRVGQSGIRHLSPNFPGLSICSASDGAGNRAGNLLFSARGTGSNRFYVPQIPRPTRCLRHPYNTLPGCFRRRSPLKRVGEQQPERLFTNCSGPS